MKRLIAGLFLILAMLMSRAADAKILCCPVEGGATCTWSSTGACPVPNATHPAWITVAAPDSNPSNAGAIVEILPAGPFEGLCFVDYDTAGQYVQPSLCARLVSPWNGVLVTVSGSYVPFDGNAFAINTTSDFASWFAGGLYASCFAGNGLKDDWGVASWSVGFNYTCSLTKQLTGSGAVRSGNFHYLPGTTPPPTLGTQPRLTATYGSHLVNHYDHFAVRTATPYAAITWHRTTNGITRASVQLGSADQYGRADVWFPAWASTDVGTNTLYVTVGSFTSNTLTFNVQ